MFRKNGGSRGPKRPPPVSAPVQSSPSLPFGALGAIGNGINSALKRYGIDECPQCKAVFNGSSCRPVQDSCCHFKCRMCFISNEDGCPQCLDSSNCVQEDGPSSQRSMAIASADTHHSRSNGINSTAQSRTRGGSQNLQHGNSAHQGNSSHPPSTHESNKSYSFGKPTRWRSSSPIELSTVPELDTPGTDTIYANNGLLKSECNGIPEFSIHENSLLNIMSYTSIINQETDFSKSLMGLRTDLPNIDVGVNDPMGRNSFSNQANELDTPSAFATPVSSSGSNETETVHLAQAQGSQDWKRKGPKKRKIVEETETTNTPRKVVRFSVDSKDSQETLVDQLSPASASLANRSERSTPSPGKSGPSKPTPKFFTQGGSNRENLKNAAIANVKLNKTCGAERKPRNTRTGKNPVECSSTSKEKPSILPKYTPHKYTRQKAHQLEKSLPEQTGATSLPLPEETQTKGRSRLSSPPSPPEVTLFKPKITYGRSSKKSKDSTSPTGSSSSDKPCSSSAVQFTFPSTSDSNATPGHSRPRLVSAASFKSNSPSKSYTTNSSVFHEDSTSSSLGHDPLAPGPSSEIRAGKDADDGDPDSKEKKKKKRNPVVIHDHITVIAGDPTMFQCKVCNKKFKTKAHIKYHEFCQNGNKPFKCEECGQGFIAKSHYEYHLRTHTGERPYVCPECGKGFNQRGKVTRHMRSHTGEKPFICVECGRGFANAQALRTHHLIHTGERPFACKYCQKRFTGMTNLKKHIITHTGERPYVCTHCGKSFGLKWTLNLHLRTHSSERPYACDQCMRAFLNSKDLRRHLVIHSGERPFKCWICGTAFRRKDNLDRHITNRHNQPKEVAKQLRQLANEAAAEYLAQSKQAPVPVSKVNSAVISNVIKSAQFPQSLKSKKKKPKNTSPANPYKVSAVTITDELSPRDESTMEDAYILPDEDESGSINSKDDSKEVSPAETTFQTIDVVQPQDRVQPKEDSKHEIDDEAIQSQEKEILESRPKMEQEEISDDETDEPINDVSYEEALEISTDAEVSNDSGTALREKDNLDCHIKNTHNRPKEGMYT